MKNAFIVDHLRQIIYVETPKCGSTTIHQIFLDIAGLQGDRGPHHYIWHKELKNERDQAGIESTRIKDSLLDKFISKYKDYKFFTVTRNPYSRCISSYKNQLRRFAKRRAPIKYISAKILLQTTQDKFLPKTLKFNFLNQALSKTISLDQFLKNLEIHGPSFDRHFDLQVNIVKPDIIPYYKIIDLENLSDDLRMLFGDLIAPEKIQRLNSSAPGALLQSMSRNNREKIQMIYEKDFKTFNYSP